MLDDYVDWSVHGPMWAEEEDLNNLIKIEGNVRLQDALDHKPLHRIQGFSNPLIGWPLLSSYPAACKKIFSLIESPELKV